jgi:hypothetical protein
MRRLSSDPRRPRRAPRAEPKMSAADARRHARVADRALAKACDLRDRQAAGLRANGCSERQLRRMVKPAEDRVAGTARIARRDRLALVARSRPRIAIRTPHGGRHRRASGSRPVRRRGSRRIGTGSRAGPDDPDESESDLVPKGRHRSRRRPTSPACFCTRWHQSAIAHWRELDDG